MKFQNKIYIIKIIYSISLSILTFCLSLNSYSLENTKNSEKNILIEEKLPVSDFENLYGFHFNLGNSKQIQPVKNIAKVLFYEVIGMQDGNNFAIDFTRKKMQENASSLYLGGLEEFKINLSEQDIETLYKLLEQSHITNWKTTYDDPDPGLKISGNGYIWKLAIQYNDGTAWYYSGESSPGNPLLPEGYDILVKGLNEFAESKKK